jgi:serine/threonine protein kinase
LNGQKELSLDKHELIDFNLLTHNECLGTGGFGAVYRGYYQEKEVAIKKLFVEDGGNVSPLQLEELEKEVAALRNLKHPRLVSFIGACLTPPNLCIVTEFMPGGSLHHLLHKAKTVLQLTSQAKIGLHVCEGVSFLHCLTPQVVHRDLKSLNIILDTVYNAKICDFGLTQSMEKTHISLKEGGNGGSPRYMAPECYDCKGKITEKVDVWAMGCILIEAFGGPLPYDDCSNIQQIVAKVLIDKEVPYIPHHLPRGVRPIVEDCFYFDIKQRTTARDVYSRLRQLHLTKAGDT